MSGYVGRVSSSAASEKDEVSVAAKRDTRAETLEEKNEPRSSAIS